MFTVGLSTRLTHEQPSLLSSHLEQVQSWVENLFDDLLQELFEHTILVDASLVHPKIVDKFHPDDSFYGVCR